MKNKIKNEIETDVLLREVADDVKNDQLRQIWDKYGIFIIIGVAFVLTLTISYESIKNWQIKRQQEVSNAYSVALSLQNQGRLDESLEVYNQLADSSSDIYADISKLRIASIYMEQDKINDALNVLDLLSKQGNVPQMRDVASLKLAAYKLDHKAPAEEIVDLLRPLIERASSSSLAQELLAMLYVRENDITKALVEYEKIIYSDNAAESMKTRAQDMINILGE